MATIITKIIVCDMGGKKCGTSHLESWRLTRDNRTKTLVLCPRHAAPLQRAWDKAEASAVSVGKGGVLDMSEIEVLKKQHLSEA